MGEKREKPCSAFGLRPSVLFCSASANNFHFGACLVLPHSFETFDTAVYVIYIHAVVYNYLYKSSFFHFLSADKSIQAFYSVTIQAVACFVTVTLET